jgi:hypothetical protein
MNYLTKVFTDRKEMGDYFRDNTIEMVNVMAILSHYNTPSCKSVLNIFFNDRDIAGIYLCCDINYKQLKIDLVGEDKNYVEIDYSKFPKEFKDMKDIEKGLIYHDNILTKNSDEIEKIVNSSIKQISEELAKITSKKK